MDKKSASESSVTAPAGEAYLPNEPLASQKEAQERYTPNDISAPADEPAAEGNVPQLDFSAYYRRDGSASEGEGSEPAFAPPIKLDFSGYDDHPWNEGPQQEPQSNVYRPREATWADTARRDVLAADGVGYIDCDSFGTQTGTYFQEGVRGNDSAVHAWIVDLSLIHI